MKRSRLGRPAPAPGLALIPRIFAILAAVLLVGSVALASLVPADTSLVEAIRAIDETAHENLHHFVVGSLGRSFWEAIMVPVLIRPVWMIPVCLGLICVGGAFTALSRASPKAKQRRS